MMIEAVLFDKDGTMFDTERLAVEGWILGAKKLGITLQPKQVVGCLGRNHEGLMHFFESLNLPGWDYDAANTIRKQHMASSIQHDGLGVKPGLYTLLEGLHARGIPMGVSSSAAMNSIVDQLHESGTEKYFSALISGVDFKHGKPEPDVFLITAQKLGVNPEHCVVLEDSPPGIEAAHRAGMIPILIPDQIPASAVNPNWLYAQVPTLTDVLPLIDQLNID